VIHDIAIGLLIARAIGACVPDSFSQPFFLVGHPLLAKIWGTLIGPLVAAASFVCSIGNVPLARAAVEERISCGVVSFIFADRLILPILPILLIYRKYYAVGWRCPCSARSTMPLFPSAMTPLRYRARYLAREGGRGFGRGTGHAFREPLRGPGRVLLPGRPGRLRPRL
jgi:Predicted permease